jgi:tyrosyl-tRNA synthetase
MAMTTVTAPANETPAPARDVYDVLRERGFVYQCSDEAGLRRALTAGQVTLYYGCDPTADSLHLGHLIGVMAMAHLQRAGHRPVALVGGGTAMIGDPTDKTAARRIMSPQEIDANAGAIRTQLQRYLDLSPGQALMVDNAEWLRPLNYIEFLRDYGRYFSVNEMLRMETYRTRLETGLTFLEFNYALLQAYDFLELYRRFGCTLQIGGSDQWSNMLAGTQLIRRADGGQAFALTWPLLMDASGEKMGKTAGTEQVWLSAERTPPYDFYQHFVNVPDEDVRRLLLQYTFLPVEEIEALTAAGGAALREAKRRLAFETTTLAHGHEAAGEAERAAQALFGGAGDGAGAAAVPTVEIERARLSGGIPAVDLLVETGLVESRSRARQLIEGGGAYLNDERLTTRPVGEADLRDGALLLRQGKKRYLRVVPR